MIFIFFTCLVYVDGSYLPSCLTMCMNIQDTGVTLIEDCAHVMGSTWRGKPLGTFGTFGCYSTQTNKLINRCCTNVLCTVTTFFHLLFGSTVEPM